MTLDSRQLKRAAMAAAAVLLFAAIFITWSACARAALPDVPPDVSASDDAASPVPLNVRMISPTDAVKSAVDTAFAGQQVVPAYVQLGQFEISAAVAVPLRSATVSSVFGFRRHPISGQYTFHSGLDLAASEGSEIFAMFSGTVTTAKYASDYGNYIIIDHGGGLETLYAHCSKLCAAVGDYVERGKVIACVGSTGRATGAHLHVEIRLDGKRLDPACVLGEYIE